MRTLITMAVLVVAALGVAACAEPADQVEVGTGDDDSDAMPDDDTGDAEITGALGGDAQLEGGCVWVDGADGERYEVLWPGGWEADADPVELRDPEGQVVAREGDEVTVRGTTPADVATVCQVGTVVEASEVETN